MDEKNEAREEILGGKSYKAEKVGCKETTGSCARKSAAEQNRGSAEKTETWIPTLPKEQPHTKARETRSQPGFEQSKP